MYKLRFTTKLQRNIKLMKKRGKDLSKLNEVFELLQKGKELPPKYKDHALTGNYANCRECHIEPDWLLIYEIINNELIIIFITTGTHSDLF
mgnify:CR=1 FL=1